MWEASPRLIRRIRRNCIHVFNDKFNNNNNNITKNDDNRNNIKKKGKNMILIIIVIVVIIIVINISNSDNGFRPQLRREASPRLPLAGGGRAPLPLFTNNNQTKKLYNNNNNNNKEIVPKVEKKAFVQKKIKKK